MLPLLMLVLAASAPPAPPEGEQARERALMVLTIANMAETAGVPATRRLDPDVLTAMRIVPRHLFVPEEVRGEAYRNVALPIGHGQTISLPFIVALMTHLLQLRPTDRVLEIGTGSGYQTAVLAELAGHVWSIEIVPDLARDAEARLARLGYENIAVRAGDGYAGWPEEAPFDRILVTAAAARVPEPLLAQLAPGGLMVIPLADGSDGEVLTLVRKDGRGRVSTERLMPVRFVPLVRAPH
ncbi:MAG TPA: protein-L-isoaspartate(D-aspartate) O-methyltransferase [Allosphingosinicella sp.]|nr:protein-L-isoaspartate(D-aspartate) O-methyltransferase [Allosphingosinicella sp.]